MVELKLSAKPCPYVVIPATPHTQHRGRFTLRVLSTVHPVSLSPIDPKNDWKYCSVRGRWGQNSSGGCRHHSSWRKNPQFMISVDRLTSMTISLQVHAQQGCSLPDCGFYVSRSHNPTRRTLTLLDDDIIVKSRFSSAPDVSEELVLEPTSSPFGTNMVEHCWRYRVSVPRSVLIAATREPRLQHEFTLSIFSDQPVRLDPIDTNNNLWKEVSVTAKWRGANGIPPRFQLLLKDSAEQTTVLPLVSQPESSDTLAFIGVSLKGRDENTVTKSKVRATWEVATEASLKPEDGPFIIEPSIKDPQAQGSFSLTVFSDKEVVVAPEITN